MIIIFIIIIRQLAKIPGEIRFTRKKLEKIHTDTYVIQPPCCYLLCLYSPKYFFFITTVPGYSFIRAGRFFTPRFVNDAEIFVKYENGIFVWFRVI